MVLTLVCCLHFTIVQIPLQLLLYVARCIDKMQHIISVFDDAYPTQISMTPTFVSSFVSGPLHLHSEGFTFFTTRFPFDSMTEFLFCAPTGSLSSMIWERFFLS